MSWVVQHYIALAGGGTVFDPDPTIAQPGEFAQDGSANNLPLTPSRPGGRIWAKAVIVDDDGIPQPAGAATFDLKIAKRTREEIASSGGGPTTSRYGWVGGGLPAAAPPGTQVVQDQAEGPTLFVAAVTGGTNVPVGGRLAISTWRDPR